MTRAGTHLYVRRLDFPATTRSGGRWVWGTAVGLFVLSLAVAAPGAAQAPPGDSSAPAPAPDEKGLFQEIPSVYTASKYDQKVTQAPSSMSIVTSDDIKRFGYRTLADILRSVRGFYVSNDRNYSFLGVRGFARPGDYNSRILLMVDGHRLNDGVYDQALIGSEFPVDVDLIDRVEIARGPASSLYGNNAFFAVVNVITRRGRELKATEASASVGDLETYTGRLTLGHRFQNGFEGIVSATFLDSQGHRRLYFPEYDTPATNNGVARNADRDEALKLLTTLAYRDLTLQAAYGTRTKHVPTASFDVDFNDNRYQTTDAQGYVDLKYQHAFNLDWEMTGRAYYDAYRFRGDYPMLGILNRDTAVGDRWGTEAQLLTRALPRNIITTGFQVDYNARQDQKNYDRDPYALSLDVPHHSTHWGLYLQDEVTLLTDLLLFNGGVRYDKYDDFTGTANPRLALIYTPTPDTAIKAVYGTAFRTPNVYERFYEAPPLKANPSLRPERITTYELIFEQYLWGWLRGSVVPFYYDVRNLINQETDPADGMLVFQNLGHVSAGGVEAELEAKWGKGWSARVAYTYEEARDVQTHNPLSNSPHHLTQANLVAPLLSDRLFSGLELQYVGGVLTRSGERLSGKVIANLTLFSTNLWIRGLDFSASVYNLFNTHVQTPVAPGFLQESIHGDGIGFRVKLTYSY